MNRADVVLGMKVVPHAKSTGKPLHLSSAYNDAKANNQPFLYVSHQHAGDVGKSDKFLLTDDERFVHCCGDYFMCSDFEPYKEQCDEPK